MYHSGLCPGVRGNKPRDLYCFILFFFPLKNLHCLISTENEKEETVSDRETTLNHVLLLCKTCQRSVGKPLGGEGCSKRQQLVLPSAWLSVPPPTGGAGPAAPGGTGAARAARGQQLGESGVGTYRNRGGLLVPLILDDQLGPQSPGEHIVLFH